MEWYETDPKPVEAYPIQVFSTLHNPADATAYFVGALPSAPFATSPGVYRIYIPRAGFITSVTFLALVAGVAGSAETGIVYIQVTTAESLWTVRADYVVSSAFTWNAVLNGEQRGFDKGEIRVEHNDYIEMKFITPTWVTNPTNVIYWGTVWIES